MKRALCLAILFMSALWAEEAADRAAVEATISALNSPQVKPEIFTTDFPNAPELQRVREQKLAIPPVQGDSTRIETSAGTLVISKEPMGEATLNPPDFSGATLSIPPRFRTRSITFVSPNTAVVVADYKSFSLPGVTALFVLRRIGEDWRIASFRPLPEAQ